jgi:hypothetical protein
MWCLSGALGNVHARPQADYSPRNDVCILIDIGVIQTFLSDTPSRGVLSDACSGDPALEGVTSHRRLKQDFD